MKLILLVQRNSWFVEHDLVWYRLDSPAALDLAMRTLPLEPIDQGALVEQPTLAGEARLTLVDGRAVQIELLAADGEIAHATELAWDMNTLASFSWLTKPYVDGWIDADSQLKTDGVRALQMRIYLPEVAGSEGKRLTITDATADSAQEHFLKRGEENEISVLSDASQASRVLRLQCEPEHIEQSTDVRQLGFVLITTQLEAA